MTKVAFLFALLATVLVYCLSAVPARAQVSRTFVSAAGSDSNNCANVTTPCRHFAAAYAATAPSGEIFVLDPANYGSLTITHAVSIEGHGWASIAPPNNGNAITINAGATDKIIIRGVSLNGVGAAGTTTGIQFNSGGPLTVENSVIRNFSGDGLDFSPPATGKLVVSNSVVSDNSNSGIAVFPTGSDGLVDAIFNRVETNNNTNYGIFVWGQQNTGGFVRATVNDSVAFGNGYGYYVLSDSGHETAFLVLHGSVAAGNTNAGIISTGGNFSTMTMVTNSVVTNNNTGIVESTGAVFNMGNSTVTGNNLGVNAASAVDSYGDNYIDNNVFDGSGPTLISRK
jgi:hypothetical protein